MKVFKVITEKDGKTTKEPGITRTDTIKVERFYACKSFKQACFAFASDRSVDDEIEDLKAIIEVIQMVRLPQEYEEEDYDPGPCSFCASISHISKTCDLNPDNQKK